MNRKAFIRNSSLALVSIPFLKLGSMIGLENITPKTYYFKDDGIIPNSKYPLLVYQNVFSERGNSGADFLEQKFKSNQWYNSWRWGVYPFHHYHSITHEVLGVFQGNALLHMGGPKGEKINVKAGDILVIPAGVGHKCISHSDDFMVVGAYPNGMEWDLIKEEKDKHHQSLINIAKVAIPTTDPVNGKTNGLLTAWKK